MLHAALTKEIIGAFYQVHYEMGFGFPESMYSAAMAAALLESGLKIEREVPIGVYFRGIRIGSLRADMIVESAVLIEYKATALLVADAEAQLLNYLRATSLEGGLLLHFGPKPQFKRMIYTNDRKLIPGVSV